MDFTAETRRRGETRGGSKEEARRVAATSGVSGHLWSAGGPGRALLNIEWGAEEAEVAEKRRLAREQVRRTKKDGRQGVKR
jgi:hypothetical protein